MNSKHFKFYSGPEILPEWGKIKGLLKKAADWSRGEWKTSDVLVKVSSGQQQVWVFYFGDDVQAVGVTELLTYPRKTVCNIYAMAGFGMQDLWKEFSQALIVWLKANNVDEIQTTCRDEVMEKLLPLGFTKAANVLHFNWKETP